MKRKEEILALLAQQRVAHVATLSDLFDVSAVTIRKDLTELENEGLITRIHGGAVLVEEGRGFEPSLKIRAQERTQEKMRIGERAAAMVESGSTIILDSGTTTGALAEFLLGREDITVVTNGVNIATRLAESGVHTLCVGGRIRSQTLSSIGPFAETVLNQVHVDTTFLATSGISAREGITNAHLEEPAVKQRMIRAARQVVVLADYSKIGKVTLARVAPVDIAAALITNKEADSSHIDAIKEMGVEVILV